MSFNWRIYINRKKICMYACQLTYPQCKQPNLQKGKIICQRAVPIADRQTPVNEAAIHRVIS